MSDRLARLCAGSMRTEICRVMRWLVIGCPASAVLSSDERFVFQMVIGQQSIGSSSNLTELQVVNLDAAAQSSKGDWLTAGAILRRQTQTDISIYWCLPTDSRYISECDLTVNMDTGIKGIFVVDPDTVYGMFLVYKYIYIFANA